MHTTSLPFEGAGDDEFTICERCGGCRCCVRVDCVRCECTSTAVGPAVCVRKGGGHWGGRFTWSLPADDGPLIVLQSCGEHFVVVSARATRLDISDHRRHAAPSAWRVLDAVEERKEAT